MGGVEQDIGRLEGKMDLMLVNQVKMDEKLLRFHERVDIVEDRQNGMEVEHGKIKRDMRWAVVIITAIVTAGKWLFTKLIHTWSVVR